MPIFFFLTGALYSQKSISFAKGLGKAVKLLALTFIWAVILWPVSAIAKGAEVLPNLWGSGVLTLQMDYINHLWFLPALAVLNLTLPFFSAVFEKARSTLGPVTLVVCLLVFGFSMLERTAYVFGMLLDTEIFGKAIGFIGLFNPLNGMHGVSLAFCLVGMWWEDRRPALPDLASVSILIGAPALLSLYAIVRMRLVGHVFDVVWNGYSSICVLLVTVALYAIVSSACGAVDFGARSWKSLPVRLLAYIGANSFGVYLLHYPLVTPYRSLMLLIADGPMKTPIELAACFALVLALAALNHVLVRTKAGNWLLSV